MGTKKEFVKFAEGFKQATDNEQKSNANNGNISDEILKEFNKKAIDSEFTLSRVLAWNYFSEVERLKDRHKSELFILNKQVK